MNENHGLNKLGSNLMMVLMLNLYFFIINLIDFVVFLSESKSYGWPFVTNKDIIYYAYDKPIITS